VQTVAQFVDQLEAEYRAAKASLDARYLG